MDAKQQRDAEEMTANTIALVRAEKSVVAQSKKKKGSSETSEPSSTTTSSPTEDKKEDVDKIKFQDFIAHYDSYGATFKTVIPFLLASVVGHLH